MVSKDITAIKTSALLSGEKMLNANPMAPVKNNVTPEHMIMSLNLLMFHLTKFLNGLL